MLAIDGKTQLYVIGNLCSAIEIFTDHRIYDQHAAPVSTTLSIAGEARGVTNLSP